MASRSRGLTPGVTVVRNMNRPGCAAARPNIAVRQALASTGLKRSPVAAEYLAKGALTSTDTASMSPKASRPATTAGRLPLVSSLTGRP